MQENIKHELNFQDRFRDATRFQKIGNKSVEYTFMNADVPTDERTVCFIPGLGLPYDTYEKSLESLHNSGRSFCAFNYIEAELPVPRVAQQWINDGFATAEHVQRALGIIAMVKGLGGVRPPVDVIAHSLGAMYAVLAATLEPELFHGLVLYAPAGFILNDDPHRIINESANFGMMLRNYQSQFKGDSEGEHARDFLAKAGRGWGAYAMAHAFNLPSQLRVVSSAYLIPMVQELRKKGKHVSVEIGKKDAIFPPELLVPVLQREGIPFVVHEEADHHSIGTEARIMQTLATRLSLMNSSNVPPNTATRIGS